LLQAMSNEKKLLCPHATSCRMFPLFKYDALLNIWKQDYCETDKYGKCARYQKALAGAVVPDNLLPNGAVIQVKAAPGR